MAVVTQNSKASKRQALVVFDSELVNATATVTGTGFTMPGGREIHSIWAVATSVAGTPDVKVYVEFAPEDTASLYIQVEVAKANLAITDESNHLTELLWVAAPWGRIKIIGQAGNPADTIVTVVVMHD